MGAPSTSWGRCSWRSGSAPWPSARRSARPVNRHRTSAAGKPASCPCRRWCGRTASRYRCPCPAFQTPGGGCIIFGRSPPQASRRRAASKSTAGCGAWCAAPRRQAGPGGRAHPASPARRCPPIPPAGRRCGRCWRRPLHPPAKRTSRRRSRRACRGICLPPAPMR